MALEPLLITRADLVKYTAINGNVDSDKFLQFIKIAQEIHIQNYLGTKLFDRLKSDVQKVIVKTPSGIALNNSGTGYGGDLDDVDTIAQAPSVGTGLQISYTVLAGSIASFTFGDSLGSGYNVGDIVTINAGNGDAEIEITALYSIPLAYYNLLEKYVKPMLVHWALYEFLPFSAYTIANKGVYKHNAENTTNVDKAEIDMLCAKQMDIAEQYTNRFLDYMSFNSNSFPEYRSNTNEDVYPSTNNNFSGWYL